MSDLTLALIGAALAIATDLWYPISWWPRRRAPLPPAPTLYPDVWARNNLLNFAKRGAKP